MEAVFFGLEAVVVQVLTAKERVKALMDFLGRKMEVERSSVLVQVAHQLADKVFGGFRSQRLADLRLLTSESFAGFRMTESWIRTPVTQHRTFLAV